MVKTVILSFAIILACYELVLTKRHFQDENYDDLSNEDNIDDETSKRAINPLAHIRAAYRRINKNTYSDCVHETTNRKVKRCRMYVGSHSIDGTCNNLRYRAQGAAHTKVPRLLKKASFIVDDMPVGYPLLRNTVLQSNVDKTPLNYYQLGLHLDRSSQEISERVFKSIQHDRKPTDEKASVLFMTMGQFIDHDFAQIEHSPGHCAKPTCQNYGDFKYPCLPILRSTSSNKGCNSFTRSRAACSTRGKTRHQINDITSYIDGSGIYGSSRSKLKSLKGKGGYMKVSKGHLLPITKSSNERCKKYGCFIAGDTRVNENPALAAMHTIWVRFHNYVARNLKKVNKRWRSNAIFYTARKIVIAVLQHIVYKEWLPMVTHIGPYLGYNYKADASLTTEFATSAFRFGHSLIRNSFELLDKNFNEAKKPLTLQEAFFNTKPIHDDGIEHVVYGLMGNCSNKVDTHFAHGLMEKLFIEPEDKNGFQSLMARNIERGRDHGLPSYFGLKKFFRQKVKSCLFEPDVFYSLKSVYKRKKKFRYTDPFVVGIAEKPDRNKLVGPLFGSLIGWQFEKIRDGDRFYYENDMFWPNQLAEIKKMDMATVLCITLKNAVSIQDNVFEAFNPKCGYRKACRYRKRINFKLFRTPVRYI